MWNVLAPKKHALLCVYVRVAARMAHPGIDVSSFIGECSSCVKTNPQDLPLLPISLSKKRTTGKPAAVIILCNPRGVKNIYLPNPEVVYINGFFSTNHVENV